MIDIYTWEDNRLFVNGEYRAVLESKTEDDGICHHVVGLCNSGELFESQDWEQISG